MSRQKAPSSGGLKVAIVGYTAHREQAPWGDPSWEIWTLNDIYMQKIPPITPERIRWFELHPWNEVGPDGKPTTFSVDRAHIPVLRKLAQQGAKVYLGEARPEEFPEGIPFPYELLKERFKGYRGGQWNYYTNTISYQIALAIMEGATEIGIYGVDMMTGGGGVINNEYGYQRPSCEYWTGLAEGLGIKLTIPKESELLKSAFPYGDYAGNIYRTKLEFELKNTVQVLHQIEGQMKEAEKAYWQHMGRKATLDWQLNTWMPGDSGHPDTRAPMPNAHKLTAQDMESLIAPQRSDGPVNRLAAIAND